MNTSEQLCISFADSAVKGNTFNMLELEARKWCDAKVYKKPVELEPCFMQFDPALPFGRISSEIKTAIPLKTYAPKRFIELIPVLDDKCAFEQCEDVIKTHSAFNYYMSFEVVGNGKAISMYATVDSSCALSGFNASWQSVFSGMKIKQISSDPLAEIEGVRYPLLHFADIYAMPPYTRKMTGYGQLASNPVVKFMTLISNLGENETGFLQVIYIPVKNNWYSNINSMIQVDPRIAGRAVFPKAMSISQVKTYGEKPLFAVKVRIGCITHNADVLDALKSYIAQFNYGGLPFRFLGKEDFSKVLSFSETKQMLVNRASHTTGMLLSSDELACFVCLPDKSVRNYGNINVNAIDDTRIQFRVPDELTGKGRLLGVNDYGGAKQTVVLPASQKNMSLYLIGASTYGKSNSMIHQILYLKDKYAVAFIDPHDSADEILGYLKEEDIERTVYFNPALEGVVPDYCPFIAGSEADIGRLVVDFCCSFESIFEGHTGYRMKHILGKLLYGIFLLGGNLTTIPVLLSRNSEAKALIRQILSKIKNAEVKRFFEHEFWTYKDDAFTPIINKLSNMFLDERLALLFSRTKNRIDIPKIIRERWLLVASLQVGTLGGDNSGSIGSFLISQFQKAAFAQASLQREKRAKVFLFVDEFHRFPAHRIITSIINECRKYGLHICLAHQETGQIPDTILKALCSIPNIMCFNVNMDDARRMAFAFGGQVSGADITKLDVGEVYAKLSNKITSFRTFPPRNDFSEEIRQRVIEHSIKNYYTPVSELQKKTVQKKREYDLF